VEHGDDATAGPCDAARRHSHKKNILKHLSTCRHFSSIAAVYVEEADISSLLTVSHVVYAGE